MSAWMDMAHDGGYRGDEQRQVAEMLEQRERARWEAQRDERANEDVEQAALEREADLDAEDRARDEALALEDLDIPF